MYEKANDLFGAFVAGRVGRRELLKQAAALGLTTAAASSLLNAASTRAMAADYNWMAHKGTALKLLLNKHPYADAMIADIEAFKSLTGMSISWDIFPEDVYFDKVTAALSSGSSVIRPCSKPLRSTAMMAVAFSAPPATATRPCMAVGGTAMTRSCNSVSIGRPSAPK